MITNGGKILSLVRDHGAVLGLDLICGASFGVKLSRDDDAVTINVAFKCFIATILEGDGDFRGSGAYE